MYIFDANRSVSKGDLAVRPLEKLLYVENKFCCTHDDAT